MENEYNILSEISSKRYCHPNIIPIYGLYKWEREIEGDIDYLFAIVMKKADCSFKDVA